MVWWIDNYKSNFSRRNSTYYETSMDILKDRIFQTASIIYSLEKEDYNAYDIKSFTISGVNIFNVDRTIYSEEFFQKMKEVIIASENLHEMYPEKYQRPIGLAVTTTVTEVIDIDDRVDLIILKDVNNLDDLLEFKKQHENKSMPILLWIEKNNMIDLNQIIKSSDGIVVHDSNTVEDNCCKVNLCKQAFKPVFYIKRGLMKGYRALPAHDRKILAVANKIVTDKFDGIILIDNNEDLGDETRRKLIQSLITAIDNEEDNINNDYEFYKLTSKIKIPVLLPKSAALAASIAAKQSGAGAIIVPTSSGLSARYVSNAAPSCHILAVTTRREVARLLHLYRKVIPLLYEDSNTVNWHQASLNRIQFGMTVALENGLYSYDAKVVILAPSSEDVGYCNSIRIVSLPMKCEDLEF